MRKCLLGVAALLMGLGAANANEAPRVVVSIKPLHALVAGLMQGAGEPTLLVKEGNTPFDYQLDARDRAALDAADLIVWVGKELEGFLAAPLAGVHKAEVLELLSIEQLKILPQRQNADARDPYFWLDSRNGLMTLDLLARVLSELDPARSHIYLNNRKRMFSELAEIDRKFEYGYRGVSGYPVLLYHDTQQYFEQAYAMRVIGHLALAVGESADAASLLQARTDLKNSTEPVCLFTERGLPDDNLELLSLETRIKTDQLDSLGSGIPPGPDHYTTLLRRHFNTIKACIDPRAASKP